MKDRTVALIPQPREFALDGWVACRSVAVRVVGTHPTLHLAGAELAALVGRAGDAGEPEFEIRVETGPHADLPRRGHQKYCIVPEGRTLRLIGEDPVGAYYAVQTLKQAVVVADARVHVPLLRVADAAELGERGFWDYFYPAPVRPTSEMHSFKDRRAWFAFLDDFASYKLNLLQL